MGALRAINPLPARPPSAGQALLPHTFLPEHLELRDCFYVRYSAAEGEQRGLELHTDGSIFSFNVLLSDPAAFEGGGTSFEPSGLIAIPGRGAAVGHSGQVRHGGAAITRGERYLLVGFVGCVASPYMAHAADAAARDAFCRFGDGAWDRGILDHFSRVLAISDSEYGVGVE